MVWNHCIKQTLQVSNTQMSAGQSALYVESTDLSSIHYSILHQSLFNKNVNNNGVKRRHINHQQTQTKNFKTALSFSHLPNTQVYHIQYNLELTKVGMVLQLWLALGDNYRYPRVSGGIYFATIHTAYSISSSNS